MQVQTDLILESELFLLGCILSVCQIPTWVSVLVIMVKREEGRALPVILWFHGFPLTWPMMEGSWKEGPQVFFIHVSTKHPTNHHRDFFNVWKMVWADTQVMTYI